MVKKLLIFILLLTSAKAFAQYPAPTGTSPALSMQGFYKITGSDTSFWIKSANGLYFPTGRTSGASGSFLNNSTSKQTSANGYVDGFLRGQKLIADSDIYLRTTTKKPWYSAYGVLNMAGDVGIRGETGAHDLMMYNNLYAVGTAFTDFKYANNGPASYVYLGNTGALAFGAAPSGTAGTSATVKDWLKIDVNGHTFLPGLKDTTSAAFVVVTDTITGQIYKMPYSGGGGTGHNLYNHDGTQTDALRTDSLGANYLQFIGDDGTHTSTHTLGPDEADFDVQSATAEGTLQVGDASSALINTTKSNGNSVSVVTNSLNGGFIDIHYQKNIAGSPQSGLFIDSTRVSISDPFNHNGLVGDELFTVSGDPNQYVQFGNIPGGGSDSTLYKTDGTIKENRTVNLPDKTLTFNGTGANSYLTSTFSNGSDGGGSVVYQDSSLMQYSVNGADGTSGSGSHMDSASYYIQYTTSINKVYRFSLQNGILFDNRNHRGINVNGTNFSAYQDSTLVPKAYVIHLIDSLGTGGSAAWGAITGILSDQTDLQSALDAKQATLVSGTTIKTINSTNILTSGNLNLQTPLTSGTDYLAPTGSAAALTGLLSSQVTTALGFTPENVANKSTTTTLGTSNTLYPTQNAVKTYVDALSSVYQPIGTYATATNSMAFSNKTGNISQWTNDSGYITSAPVASVFGRTGTVVAASNDYTFAQIGSKPTTLSGYGITDAYPLSGNPSSFLTANQSISFAPTGEVTGTTSGTTTLAPALTVSNSAVIGKVLTGYTSGAGTVASTDNILQAIQKLNGNDGLKADLASPIFSGTPSLPTGTTAVTQAYGDNSTKLQTTAFGQANFSHIVLSSNTKISNTGNTTENTIFTGTIPANSIGIDGSFDIILLASAAQNNANVKTLKVKIGGTSIATIGTLTSNLFGKYYITIHNRHAANSQFAGDPGSQAQIGFGTSTITPVTYAFDTSTNLTFTITAQCAVGTDTISLEAFQLRANP